MQQLARETGFIRWLNPCKPKAYSCLDAIKALTKDTLIKLPIGAISHVHFHAGFVSVWCHTVRGKCAKCDNMPFFIITLLSTALPKMWIQGYFLLVPQNGSKWGHVSCTPMLFDFIFLELFLLLAGFAQMMDATWVFAYLICGTEAEAGQSLPQSKVRQLFGAADSRKETIFLPMIPMFVWH